MSKTVYQQVLVAGSHGDRIIMTENGGLIAQTRRWSDNKYIRASTKQAASLFRDALAVSLLMEGDDVIAWNGAMGTFYRCTYRGRNGENHVVERNGNHHDSFETRHAVPLKVAQADGIWGFRKGIPVNARTQDGWVDATYVRYDDEVNLHYVRVGGRGPEVKANFITLPM